MPTRANPFQFTEIDEGVYGLALLNKHFALETSKENTMCFFCKLCPFGVEEGNGVGKGQALQHLNVTHHLKLFPDDFLAAAPKSSVSADFTAPIAKKIQPEKKSDAALAASGTKQKKSIAEAPVATESTNKLTNAPKPKVTNATAAPKPQAPTAAAETQVSNNVATSSSNVDKVAAAELVALPKVSPPRMKEAKPNLQDSQHLNNFNDSPKLAPSQAKSNIIDTVLVPVAKKGKSSTKPKATFVTTSAHNSKSKKRSSTNDADPPAEDDEADTASLNPSKLINTLISSISKRTSTQIVGAIAALMAGMFLASFVVELAIGKGKAPVAFSLVDKNGTLDLDNITDLDIDNATLTEAIAKANRRHEINRGVTSETTWTYVSETPSPCECFSHHGQARLLKQVSFSIPNVTNGFITENTTIKKFIKKIGQAKSIASKCVGFYSLPHSIGSASELRTFLIGSQSPEVTCHVWTLDEVYPGPLKPGDEDYEEYMSLSRDEEDEEEVHPSEAVRKANALKQERRKVLAAKRPYGMKGGWSTGAWLGLKELLLNQTIEGVAVLKDPKHSGTVVIRSGGAALDLRKVGMPKRMGEGIKALPTLN